VISETAEGVRRLTARIDARDRADGRVTHRVKAWSSEVAIR
jgi:hypothetical protein